MTSLEGLLEGIDLFNKDGNLAGDDDFSNSHVHQSLSLIRSSAEAAAGRIPIVGRWHRPPRTITSDYVLSSHVLGTGLNGSVRMATSQHNADGPRFAVKQFALEDLPPEEVRIVRAEVVALLCLDHPHISRLVDVYESSRHLILVMECLEGGELGTRLGEVGRFEEPAAADAVLQIMLALNYLHTHGIAHRDIKDGNVIFESRGGSHLKLIDFGFSKDFEEDGRDDSDAPLCPEVIAPRRMSRLKTQLGTASYMAPEVIGPQPYTCKCDIWSVGVIVYHLLTGALPFNVGSTPLHDASTPRLSVPGASKLACEFTQALLETNPDLRPSAKQALEHAWILPSIAQARVPVGPGVVPALRDFAQMSPLRRCVLSLVAWSLAPSDRAKVRQDFLEMDQSHAGSLSIEDFRSRIRGGSQVFRELDTNKATEMSYTEFLAAMLPTEMGLNRDMLRAAFIRICPVARGEANLQASVETLRAVFGDSVGEVPVEELIVRMGAAEGGSLSFDAFASFALSAETPQERPPPQSARSPPPGAMAEDGSFFGGGGAGEGGADWTVAQEGPEKKESKVAQEEGPGMREVKDNPRSLVFCCTADDSTPHPSATSRPKHPALLTETIAVSPHSCAPCAVS